MAMAALAPPMSPRHGSFFELPHKKWRRRRITTDLILQEERNRIAREAEMESKARAYDYLTSFLHTTPWTDQLDQITVAWDSVPCMETLESYGHLDEKQGTLYCRRLFKAVVVWDELGHLLWQTLKASAEQQQSQDFSPSSSQASTPPIEKLFNETSDSWWHSPRASSFRRGSDETSHSSLASRGSVSNAGPLSLERDYNTFSSLNSLSSDTNLAAAANQNRKRSDSLSAIIPRSISSSCVSAVKKRLGVFSEKQTA